MALAYTDKQFKWPFTMDKNILYTHMLPVFGPAVSSKEIYSSNKIYCYHIYSEYNRCSMQPTIANSKESYIDTCMH